MRYAIIVLALLGVLVSPRPAAAAGFYSGNQLLADCKASELACTMYVTGWRDAFHTAMLFITAATYEKRQHKPKMGICIPDAVTNGQLTQVILKYLRDHPAKLGLNTGHVALRAMHKAFPC